MSPLRKVARNMAHDRMSRDSKARYTKVNKKTEVNGKKKCSFFSLHWREWVPHSIFNPGN